MIAEELDHALRDDHPRMMFTCRHPAFAPETRVALTLKLLGGFGVPEIGRAFLTPEATIAQRLVRAKRAIKTGAVAFATPDPDELPTRLDSVLDVLYLVFNEGYSAHRGNDLVRVELCAEAIRLTSILADHPIGDRPKVLALLALLLLRASRLPARTDAAGDLLPLQERDRSRWDGRLISAGVAARGRSARGEEMTEFHLLARIAACHATAFSIAETDWSHILTLYDDLLARRPSPVYRLNRAVAVAEVNGVMLVLAEVERLRDLQGMTGYHLYHATAADLLRRAGEHDAAERSYRIALGLATDEAERRFLERRLLEAGVRSA